MKLEGTSIASNPSSPERLVSISLMEPSVSTSTTGRSSSILASGLSSPNNPSRIASLRVISPSFRLFSKEFMAASMSSDRSSTHSPRTWTRGTFRHVSSSNSVSERGVSPTATSHSYFTIDFRPKCPWLIFQPPSSSGAFSLSFRPMRELGLSHHDGRRTPKPFCSRCGADSRRNE